MFETWNKIYVIWSECRYLEETKTFINFDFYFDLKFKIFKLEGHLNYRGWGELGVAERYLDEGGGGGLLHYVAGFLLVLQPGLPQGDQGGVQFL